MLSEEEKRSIEMLNKYIYNHKVYNIKHSDGLENCIETVLNLITKLEKEVEHQIEKRNNQKAELAILNEKQKEMNKLINTVKSYKGMFKKLQKENKLKDKQIDFYKKGLEREIESNRDNIMEIIKKDKIIDLIAEELWGEFYLTYINGYGINNKEELKQYFERKVK